MSIFSKFINFLKSLFKKKEIPATEINKTTTDKHEIEKEVNKTLNPNKFAIENVNIRELYPYEIEYMSKVLNDKHIRMTKSNYKHYMFSNSIKYKNKVFTLVSLYKISNIRRTNTKYILVYMHSNNADNNSKLKLKYKLLADFTNAPYTGNFNNLLNNKYFIDKIWKKVKKLYNTEIYEKFNKK